jgi:hypothetical protein
VIEHAQRLDVLGVSYCEGVNYPPDQAPMPSNRTGVPPRVATRSSSLSPGVDRMCRLQVTGIVGPIRTWPGGAHGDEVPQRLGGEDDRVEIELHQISARLFLGHRADPVGEALAYGIRARGIGGQVAAAKRWADLEPGKRSSVPSKIRCDSAIVVSRAGCHSCW